MKRKTAIRHGSLSAAVILAVLFGAILLTIRSYSYSDHLAYSDVIVSTDEGLFYIMLPLALLAPGHEAENNWQTFKRHKAKGWTTDMWVAANGSTKIRLREYLAMLGKRGNDETLSIGSCCGFGYVFFDAIWTSDSRPGPMLWVMAPVWAVAAFGTAAIGVPIYLRARFGIRSLLLLMAIVAVILILPTLHAF